MCTLKISHSENVEISLPGSDYYSSSSLKNWRHQRLARERVNRFRYALLIYLVLVRVVVVRLASNQTR